MGSDHELPIDRSIEWWYEHVDELNGLEKPEPFGQCDDKRVEQWVQSNSGSDKHEADFEDILTVGVTLAELHSCLYPDLPSVRNDVIASNRFGVVFK